MGAELGSTSGAAGADQVGRSVEAATCVLAGRSRLHRSVTIAVLLIFLLLLLLFNPKIGIAQAPRLPPGGSVVALSFCPGAFAGNGGSQLQKQVVLDAGRGVDDNPALILPHLPRGEWYCELLRRLHLERKGIPARGQLNIIQEGRHNVILLCSLRVLDRGLQTVGDRQKLELWYRKCI